MTTDTKDPNPKEAYGSAKPPVGLVPDCAIADESMAYLEGALKYGRANFIMTPVKASTYHDAMRRHTAKYWNGQNRDPVTRVKELAYVRACAGILIAAELAGTLIDDRPPMAPLGELLDINMELVAHLKDLFKDFTPRHYTIEDSPELAPVELFPEAYQLTPDPLQPEERVVGMLPVLAAPFGSEPTVPAPALVNHSLVPGRLTLACGCHGYCKGGHPALVVPMGTVEPLPQPIADAAALCTHGYIICRVCNHPKGSVWGDEPPASTGSAYPNGFDPAD